MISRSLHTTAIPSNSSSLSLWSYGLVELDSAMRSIMNVRIRVIVKPTFRIRNLIRIVVPFETRHHTVFPLGVVLPQVHRPCHRSFSGEITIGIHHVLQEILASNHIAVPFRHTRPALEHVAVAGYVRLCIVPWTLTRCSRF
jgi:hypothetical protein